MVLEGTVNGQEQEEAVVGGFDLLFVIEETADQTPEVAAMGDIPEQESFSADINPSEPTRTYPNVGTTADKSTITSQELKQAGSTVDETNIKSVQQLRAIYGENVLLDNGIAQEFDNPNVAQCVNSFFGSGSSQVESADAELVA